MARIRTTSPALPRRRRGVGAFLKQWTIPVIAGVPPLALMVINIAAFLVQHIEQFRWTVAVLAFLSGMMINSYIALNLFRLVQRHFPNLGIFHPSNEEIVVALGMGAITVISFLVAFFSYRGLDAHNLPDKFTFIYGTGSILGAVIVKLFFDKERTRPAPPRSGVADRQPAGAMKSGPPSSGGPSGYTPPPPSYLPPS